MRLPFWLLGGSLASLGVAPGWAANQIMNVELSPSSPAALLRDELVTVSFDYVADPAAGVHIHALAYTNGDPTPNQDVQGSNVFPSGVGNGAFALTVTSGSAKIHDVVVRMTTLDEASTLTESSTPVTYHFGGIARLIDFHLVPSPPAILNFGDSVAVSFQYTTLVGSFLFVYPYTGAAPTPGGGAHEIALTGSGFGIASFTVQAGQSTISVDRVLAQVSDANEFPLLDFYIPASYAFQNPVAIIPANWGTLKSRDWNLK